MSVGDGPDHLDLELGGRSIPALPRQSRVLCGRLPIGVEQVTTPRLALVHGQVGGTQEPVGVVEDGIGQRHTDADGDVESDLTQHDRAALDRVEDPLGDDGGLVRAGEVVAHHHELVATGARDGVARADGAPDPVGHLHQESVAPVVAIPVVDRLEPVQVAEEDRHRQSRPAGPGQHQRQPVDEGRPVAHPGEGVVGGLVGQPTEVVLSLEGDGHQRHSRCPDGGPGRGGRRLITEQGDDGQGPTIARRSDRQDRHRPEGRVGYGVAPEAGVAAGVHHRHRFPGDDGLAVGVAQPERQRGEPGDPGVLGVGGHQRQLAVIDRGHHHRGTQRVPGEDVSGPEQRGGHRLATGDQLEHLGLALGEEGRAATPDGSVERIAGEADQSEHLVARRRFSCPPGEPDDAGQVAAVAETDPQDPEVGGVGECRQARLGQKVPRSAGEDVAGPLEAGGQPTKARQVHPLTSAAVGDLAGPGPQVREVQGGAVGGELVDERRVGGEERGDLAQPGHDRLVEGGRRAADEPGGDRGHQGFECDLFCEGPLGPVPVGDVADDAQHLCGIRRHEAGLHPAGRGARIGGEDHGAERPGGERPTDALAEPFERVLVGRIPRSTHPFAGIEWPRIDSAHPTAGPVEAHDGVGDQVDHRLGVRLHGDELAGVGLVLEHTSHTIGHQVDQGQRPCGEGRVVRRGEEGHGARDLAGHPERAGHERPGSQLGLGVRASRPAERGERDPALDRLSDSPVDDLAAHRHTTDVSAGYRPRHEGAVRSEQDHALAGGERSHAGVEPLGQALLRVDRRQRGHPMERGKVVGVAIGGRCWLALPRSGRITLVQPFGFHFLRRTVSFDAVGRQSYSHSMVPGGLLVTSYATRLTPSTSLMIRLDMRSRRS